jgi:hypothetical protein
MAVTATLYDTFRRKLLTGADLIDFETDDIYLALVDNTYTPDRTADEYWSTPQANEITGAGYTAGGILLSSVTVDVDATGHFAYFDAADVSWDPSTITARYGVLYRSTGTPATSPLVGYIDFGSDESSVAGPFALTFAAPADGALVKL